MVGFHCLPVDLRVKVCLQRMRPMGLRRDGVGQLPSAGGGVHRVQFLAVQNKVYALHDISHRDIGKRDVPRERRTGVKGGADGNVNGVHAEVGGTAVAVDVRNRDLHGIAADREVFADVLRNHALGNVQHGLCDAVDRDLHHAAARGQLVLKGRPVQADETFPAVGDRPAQPAAGIGYGEDRVVPGGAAPAAAGEGAEGTCHHLVVGGEIQIPGFHKRAVHLAGEQKLQIGKALLHILRRRHGKLRVPGGVGRFVLCVLCRRKRLAGGDLRRPRDGFRIIRGLRRICGSAIRALRNGADFFFCPRQVLFHLRLRLGHLLRGCLHGRIQRGHVQILCVDLLDAGHEGVPHIRTETGRQEPLQFFL